MVGAMERWGSYVAAGILATLVLSVFGALRDYGPDSALRRFHQAAISGDDRALQSVTKQPVNSNAVQYLRDKLRALDYAGARIRMGEVRDETRIDTNGSESVKVPSVITEVRYYVPGRIESIFWVVDHDPSGWVVNAYETVMFPVKRFGVGTRG